jgi:two-component system chemotaxis response regulator CheB
MNSGPLHVLIVDDSRIFRGVIEEALAACPDVKVIGSVWSGEKALEIARNSLPDFVTLDIQMPGLGGLETLKALRELSAAKRQPVGVLLISAYTKRGAAVTIEGLQEGAFDFITKPAGPDPNANAFALKQQLLERLAAFRSSRLTWSAVRLLAQPAALTLEAPVQRGTQFLAVVMGSSTGGPEALAQLLPSVAPHCPVPIYLVQHLPPDFTEYFASSLARRCGSHVVEAQEGMVPTARGLYVAPGGKHLVLHSQGERTTIGLSDEPPENGCRPAVDVLFRSAAAAYGSRVLAVVLTGMGSDGARGAVVLKRAGARVVVQDEGSSVVWGMPGSTVAAGAADEVLPLAEIGISLRRHLGIGE